MPDRPPLFDVAIIGAGMAGLTCAQQLQQAGYSVIILEKSRGVGGRVATKRLPNGTRADHGTCYLKKAGDPQFQAFLQNLIDANILQVWTDQIHELNRHGQLNSPNTNQIYPRYVAPAGMTAIAKNLATDLSIQFNHRVETISLTSDPYWRLESASAPDVTNHKSVLAKALVITIPAPQAYALLAPLEKLGLASELIEQVRSIEFFPCISVMAGYTRQREEVVEPKWQAIACPDDPDLRWIGLDSSKRPTNEHLVFVIQSSAAFAEQYLEAPDLQSAGQQLLDRVANLLHPWFSQSNWLQVHRWRYAFAKKPAAQPYLMDTSVLPIVCSGDWCNGDRVEHAFLSGLATANAIQQHLERNSVQ
jgi:renalase